MVASSGFQGSHGYAALGNAVCIAPTCLHGNQNGPQWMCICFLVSPFLLDIIVAEDHVRVH
jgi:hypothetical protein